MRFRKRRFLLLAILMAVGFVYIEFNIIQDKKPSAELEDDSGYSDNSLHKMKAKLSEMEEKVLSWKALDDYNFMEEHFYDAVLQAEPLDDVADESVQIDQNDHEDVQPWNELEVLNERQAPADDPKLIQHLRKYWIYPPCSKPYMLADSTKSDFSMGQSAVVDKLLKEKTGGVYVDCGAMDGETMSNTLFFERERQWQGLLIEAGPINFRFLKNKHRKVHSTPACIGIDQYPKQMSFHRGRSHGRLIDSDEALDWIRKKGMRADTIGVQCFPLYSLLLAANYTSIDYLSLDLSGVEFKLLKSLPFDKVDIKVLSVESGQDSEGPEAIQDLVESKGYTMVRKVVKGNGLTADYIFLKDSLLGLLDVHNK